MGASPQSGFQGLIKTILSSLAPQPASTAAPTGPTSDGGWNDNWGGGNAPAASPDAGGDMSEAIPGLPSGTTPPNAVSAIPPGVLNQPYPVKKRRPLDYLMMAASPVVSGLVQSLLVRRHRGRAFAAGALQTGFGEAASELERPERIKALQHQRDIENILLQKNVRGTPIQGVDPNTGVGKTIYPGTQEVIPGIGPQPRVARIPKIVTQRDEQGNETPYEVNDKGQATPVTTQQGGIQVPLVSKPKPEKPLRELRKGNTVPGGKKHSKLDPEQYYWMEQGKDPQPSGLMVGESDKPVKDREGDIARAERKQINDASMQFMQEARSRKGAEAKAEDVANEALRLFNDAAKTSKPLRQYSNQISTVIRNVGKNAKSGDALDKLLQLLGAGDTSQPAPPQQ